MNEIKTTDKVLSFYEGLPNVDAQTGRIVNYIFERMAGIIPSMLYSAESKLAIDSLKREYTYALMQHKINGLETVNQALERVRDAKLKFVPSPGEFIEFCQKPMKHQTDTREHGYYEQFALESDEHKERRRRNGQRHIGDLLKMLLK